MPTKFSRAKNLRKSQPSWPRLTAADQDTYEFPRARQTVFRKFPHAVLTRNPDLQDAAWELECSADGCNHLVRLDVARSQPTDVCVTHRFPHFDGVIILADHIKSFYRQNLLVKVDYSADSRQVVWYIACQNCGDLLNVTNKKHAHRRHCRPCKALLKKTALYAKELPAGSSLIIAYTFGKRAHGARIRAAMMRCMQKGCENITRYSPERVTNATAFCQPCSMRQRARVAHRSRYLRFAQQAYDRKVPFNITFEQYKRLLKQGSCHYCGLDLEIREFVSSTLSYTPEGKSGSCVDRKDCTKGYHIGNVVLCCTPCNLTKARWVIYEEMVVLGAMRSGNTARAVTLMKRNSTTSVRHAKKLRTLRNMIFSQKYAGKSSILPAKHQKTNTPPAK